MGHMAAIKLRGTVQTGNPVRLAFSSQPSEHSSAARPIDRAALERVASGILTDRRNRFGLFDHDLFADPAWDILLVLTIAELRQRRVTITQLCERVDVPTTTALRWIARMTDDGLLIRRNDMTDKRRKFIELSPDALRKMVQYCSTAAAPRLLAA